MDPGVPKQWRAKHRSVCILQRHRWHACMLPRLRRAPALHVCRQHPNIHAKSVQRCHLSDHLSALNVGRKWSDNDGRDYTSNATSPTYPPPAGDRCQVLRTKCNQQFVLLVPTNCSLRNDRDLELIDASSQTPGIAHCMCQRSKKLPNDSIP